MGGACQSMTEQEDTFVYVVVTDSDHPGRYADRVYTNLDQAEQRRFEIEEKPAEADDVWIVRRKLRGLEPGEDNRPVPYDLVPKDDTS